MALVLAVFGSLALGLQPARMLRSSATPAAARIGAPVMVALKSRVTPVPDRARSFGRKRDAAVSDEAMRWYLTSIGTRQLLDNEEEVRLASAVKELLRCVLITLLGRIGAIKLRIVPRGAAVAAGAASCLGRPAQIIATSPSPATCAALLVDASAFLTSHPRPPRVFTAGCA
jgi:hypothetical protein